MDLINYFQRISDKYKFTWFILIFTISSVFILILSMLILKFDILIAGEIIGILGLSATMVAVFYAWLASREQIDLLKDLTRRSGERTIKTFYEYPDRIGKRDFSIIRDKHFILELEIINLLKSKNIKFIQEYAIRLLDKTFRIDFILDINEEKIPIELKVYTKRIIFPQSRNLVQRLRKTMFQIMDALPTKISIMVIWNPEINTEPMHLLETSINDSRIKIIQNENIEGLINDLSNYLDEIISL
jgi:hypothetical protein